MYLGCFSSIHQIFPNTIIIFLIEKTKRKVFTGDPNVGFILRAMGCRSPLFSIMCQLGSLITLSKAFGSPFSQNLSQFRPIFTHVFSVFALCTPVVAVFVCQASLLIPDFAPFIFWAAFGTPVKLLSEGGSGVGVPLPTKIESIVETFLLARPLSLS